METDEQTEDVEVIDVSDSDGHHHIEFCEETEDFFLNEYPLDDDIM